jgi:thiopurine S-methyltransferase
MNPNVSSATFWDHLYDEDKAGWDMGTPTPVFVEMIQLKEVKPCRICVLGSGSGHDAIYFSQQGFDVVSVEFSSLAAKIQRKGMEEAKVEYELVTADLFGLANSFYENFDLVVEYVTMCALDTSRYDEFAKVVYDILKPGGRYLSLLFPIEVRRGGPPFAMNEKQVVELFSKYMNLIMNTEHDATIKPRKGRERLLIFEKSERSTKE